MSTRTMLQSMRALGEERVEVEVEVHLGKERVTNMVNTVVFSPGSVIRPKMRMGVGWNWGGGGGEEEKRRRRGGGDEEEEGGEEHLVGVPDEPLVDAVEQVVRVALGLEVLHGHDDAAVVAHIIVVVPLENLVGESSLLVRPAGRKATSRSCR